MVLFVFGQVVVTLFALGTLQSDFSTHYVTSVIYDSFFVNPPAAPGGATINESRQTALSQ